MMVQESQKGSQKREQYYEYFYRICAEIDEFIDQKNGPLSHTKKDEIFRLMVEKTISPFVYWKPEHIDSEKLPPLTMEQINKLDALTKNFKLKEENGRYTTTYSLESERFTKLQTHMVEMGFRYDMETKSFSREAVR
ncbi:MAG: hypothetical protein ACYCSO_05315 [Cuniculiplasma sp.]